MRYAVIMEFFLPKYTCRLSSSITYSKKISVKFPKTHVLTLIKLFGYNPVDLIRLERSPMILNIVN